MTQWNNPGSEEKSPAHHGGGKSASSRLIGSRVKSTFISQRKSDLFATTLSGGVGADGEHLWRC